MRSNINYSSVQRGGVEHINQNIDRVKDIVSDNISQSLERGERLEDLSRRSEALAKSAQQFNRVSRKTRRHECLKNYRSSILGCGFFSAMCYAVAAISCGIALDQC